jgi:hypothetical protein
MPHRHEQFYTCFGCQHFYDITSLVVLSLELPRPLHQSLINGLLAFNLYLRLFTISEIVLSQQLNHFLHVTCIITFTIILVFMLNKNTCIKTFIIFFNYVLAYLHALYHIILDVFMSENTINF